MAFDFSHFVHEPLSVVFSYVVATINLGPLTPNAGDDPGERRGKW